MYAAIDLGDMKIEAALLDENLAPLKSHRIPTPNESYGDLLTAINDQTKWLKTQMNDPDLTVDIGVPSFANPVTYMVLTPNLQTKSKSFRKNISKLAGQAVPIEDNRCRFTLSEASDGAGANYKNVFSSNAGTDVAQGICVNGKLTHSLNNQSIELGHIKSLRYFAVYSEQ